MTIFAYITRVFAITGDTIVLYKTLATVLTGIGSFAGIYEKKERQISRAKPTLDLGQFSGPKSMTN